MMEDLQLVFGDKVTVVMKGHMFSMFSQGPMKICSVARVTKTFVELNDGSKWKHWGGEHPRPGEWSPSSKSIRRTTEEDERILRTRAAWVRVARRYRQIEKTTHSRKKCAIDSADPEIVKKIAELLESIPVDREEET